MFYNSFPRWRELVARAQFIISPVLPVPFVPLFPRWRELVARAQFIIHNSPPRLTCPICPTFRLTIIMCPQHKRTFRITSFKIHQYLFTYFRDKEESYLKCLLFYHLNKVIPIYKWYPYLFLSIYPLFCYLYRYLLCKY